MREESDGKSETVFIAPEMLIRGSEVVRKGKSIRQAVVMVGPITHLITSGDWVTRNVYDTLVAMGYVVDMPKGTGDGESTAAGGD
jgi:hypothetical protein